MKPAILLLIINPDHEQPLIITSLNTTIALFDCQKAENIWLLFLTSLSMAQYWDALAMYLVTNIQMSQTQVADERFNHVFVGGYGFCCCWFHVCWSPCLCVAEKMLCQGPSIYTSCIYLCDLICQWWNWRHLLTKFHQWGPMSQLKSCRRSSLVAGNKAVWPKVKP